jgi:hypothetical protein
MRRNPYWDAIMDVVVWLRSLGLAKYEADGSPEFDR